MSRPTQRPALLDAAAALLIEVGPFAFTLDAVAARAGVSKGGILYHFPSKPALYRALAEREIAAFEAKEAAAVARLGGDAPGPAALAEAYLRTGFAHTADTNRLHHALMIAAMADPEALAPFHAWIRARLAHLVAQPGGPEAALRMLAGDGLWLLETLGGPLPAAIQAPLLAALLPGGDPGAVRP